jgi:hypothetical protein
MKPLPRTANPLIVRTDFENQQAWEAICELVGSPAHFGDDVFPAHIECLEDGDDRGLNEQKLVEGAQKSYALTRSSWSWTKPRLGIPSSPSLVVGLGKSRGRSFRAIPSQIQGIENNLSIANLGFEEIADAVDADGTFRGFPKA